MDLRLPCPRTAAQHVRPPQTLSLSLRVRIQSDKARDNLAQGLPRDKSDDIACFPNSGKARIRATGKMVPLTDVLTRVTIRLRGRTFDLRFWYPMTEIVTHRPLAESPRSRTRPEAKRSKADFVLSVHHR
jgi:hypothetical protein